MNVCVSLRRLCLHYQHHVCLIITPQSFLASLTLSLFLSLPRSLLNPSLSLSLLHWGFGTKQSTQSCRGNVRLSGAVPALTTITQSFSLAVSSFNPTLLSCKTPSFCYSTLFFAWNVLVFLYTSVEFNLPLSCGDQLEPHVSFFTQRASFFFFLFFPFFQAKENIFLSFNSSPWSSLDSSYWKGKKKTPVR